VSFDRYTLGLALLVAVLASATLGAVAVRRRWLALWTGAPARLAEAVGGLTIVLTVAEVLGVVGLFRMPLVVAGSIALGLGLAVGLRADPAATGHRPRAPAVPAWTAAIALTALILVLAQWAASLGPTFHGGMTGPDTLGYHGPIAATFVQRASIVHPPFINTDPTIASFPMTSELIHAIGILLFSRDVLSPFINLGWLTLGALAAWCIGRPRGVGAAAVLAALVLLNVPAFSTSQPSSGDNDTMALALLLTSLALLFTTETTDQRGIRSATGAPAAIALAGAAAGFSLATKVTMFAPVGLLVLAVLVVLAGARNRVIWLVSVIATSSVWFLRNWFAFGNPVPAVRLGIGPVALPSAHVPTGASVADYLTDGRIWREVFLPSLHGGFTILWPVILAAALLGAATGIGWGATRLDRLLGVAAVLSMVAYAVTPRTGFLLLVAINLRYLGPALAIALVLVFRVPFARRLRGPWVLAVLSAGVLVELANRAEAEKIAGFPLLSPTPHFTGTLIMWVAVALALAATALVITGGTTLFRPWVALGIVAVLGFVLWPSQRTYLRTRYATGALAFARPLRHQRIAFVGYLQPYPLFGLDLSNSVTEISHHGPHGAQTEIESCRGWRRALVAGHYQYVVTSPPYQLVFPSAPDYAAWTQSDPAATAIGRFPDGLGGAITVFRLHGPMHPELCR
jgi:hypothetical protein